MRNPVSARWLFDRINVLNICATGTFESVLRQATLKKVAHALWPVLSLDQQIQILLTLLNGMAYYNEVSRNRS